MKYIPNVFAQLSDHLDLIDQALSTNVPSPTKKFLINH